MSREDSTGKFNPGRKKIVRGRPATWARDWAFPRSWWDHVMRRFVEMHLNEVMTIERIRELIPEYCERRKHHPNGTSTQRHLRPILHLISRGPNHSLGKGATYRIKDPREGFEHADEEWLLQQAERMSGGKMGKGHGRKRDR